SKLLPMPALVAVNSAAFLMNSRRRKYRGSGVMSEDGGELPRLLIVNRSMSPFVLGYAMRERQGPAAGVFSMARSRWSLRAARVETSMELSGVPLCCVYI